MPPGTLVIVKPIDPQDVKIGTVVTYQLYSGEADVVTHRVVSINSPSLPNEDPTFITKGDANSEPDAKAVKSVQLRGAVWYSVPYIGWVNNIVNGDMRAVVIPIVACLLFLYAGWSIVSNQIERKRKRQRAEADELEELAEYRRQKALNASAPDFVPDELVEEREREHRFPSGS